MCTSIDDRSRTLRRWLPPSLFTAFIWLTLPAVSGVRRWIKNHVGEWPIRYLATTLLVAVGAVACHHFLRRARVRDRRFWLQIAVLAALYGVSLEIYGHEAIEQMHLFEYGLLAVLVLRALPDRLTGARRQLAAATITASLGFLDECLQGLINHYYEPALATLVRWFDSTPDQMKNFFFIRFFDWRDVRLNVTSAILGLWAWALWRSAPSPDSRVAPLRRSATIALSLALAVSLAASTARAREFPYGPFTGPEETVATNDGHMLIHFTREGADAVDDRFVAWGRESLELAWAEWIGRLGWRAPASDAGQGGDDRYDVYLMSFGKPGIPDPNHFNRGVTFPDGGIPGASHILVNADIRAGGRPDWHPLQAVYSERIVRSVFGHELIHACQMAYGPVLEGFLSENSATYHQVDLYGILESDDPKDRLFVTLLMSERFAIPAFSVHSLVPLLNYVPAWSKYLVDSRGGDRTILRRIYEATDLDTYGGSFAATERVLRETGGDLATDFQTYAEWNYKVGPRADGDGYALAERFASVFGSVNVTFEHDAVPASGESGAHSPRPLASNYVRFAADPAHRDGVFRFDGLAGMKWGLSILMRDASTQRYAVTRVVLDESRSAIEIPLPDWNAADDRVAVISNLSFNVLLGGPIGTYRYTIDASKDASATRHDDGGCGTLTDPSADPAAVLVTVALLLAGARGPRRARRAPPDPPR